MNDDSIVGFQATYLKKLKEYHPQAVFNCEETGLFFKCTPTKTLCSGDENQISGKFSKERVSILFCVSLAGEKLNPVLIGKSKMPRGFRDLNFEKLNITYEYNKKAWMKIDIFSRWLEKLNERMKNFGRKILLTLDNAPVHPVGVNYSNVELLFFPPNVSSKIQPLDQELYNPLNPSIKRKLTEKFALNLIKIRIYRTIF